MCSPSQRGPTTLTREVTVDTSSVAGDPGVPRTQVRRPEVKVSTTEQSASAADAALAASPSDAGREANGSRQCEFSLAPPVHIHYPAILLLLAEESRHGYALVGSLRDLGFGPISRPSVYRALGDLERDGLVTSWDAAPLAGSTRHVYAVTPAGHRRLAEWIDVVARERDALDGMVDRFVQRRPGDAAID